MVKEKILFEIPIYAMSENQFTKRWTKIKKESYDFMSKGRELTEEKKRIVDESYFPMDTWKYNQIVGYIIISAINKDIVFEIYSCPTDLKYYAKSREKHFMRKLYLNGQHFGIYNLTEEQIKEKILEYLEEIEKSQIPSRFYVDFSTFKNIFPYINIIEIFNNKS